MNEDVFKRKLNPEQYRIMRQGGTETPFSGRHWNNEKNGTYTCAACAEALFSSKDKFDAGDGWPTFHRPINEKSLEYKKRGADPHGMDVRCKKCHSHIGTLLADERGHYRINSIALDFKERDTGAMLGDIKEKLETAKDVYDERETGDEAGEKSSFSNALGGLSSLSQFFGGGVLGAVIGATATLLLCHMTSLSPQSTTVLTSTSTAATSSTLLLPPGTTTTPVTPRATTTPLQESATLEPTSDSADTSTNTPDGTSPAAIQP